MTLKIALTSKYYSFDNRTTGDMYHAVYGVSVTYTFGYGKKINRENELTQDSTIDSAILK